MEKKERFEKILTDLQSAEEMLAKIIFLSLQAFARRRVSKKELEQIYELKDRTEEILRKVIIALLEMGTEDMKRELHEMGEKVVVTEEIFSVLPDKTGLNSIFNTSLAIQESVGNLQRLITAELSNA